VGTGFRSRRDGNNDLGRSTRPKEDSFFRGLVGLLSVTGSLIGFGGLFFVAIPAGNRDALMLALGIVFGWGSAVVQSEYGASHTGRRVAESALKSLERG
jgi:drug/metabolite transporter (DMT)-like permease